MFADGATVPDGTTIETDVCVLGAGPAGVAIARDLATAGHEILLLERGVETGPPVIPDTAVNTGISYDLHKSRSFEVGGAVQRWHVDTPMGPGFGRLRELEPHDFERREWVPNSGWPFGIEHLKPYYARARALFDCPWPSDDPEPVWDEELGSGPVVDGAHFETRAFAFGDPSTFPGPLWRSIKNSASILALTGVTGVEIRRRESPSLVSSLQARTSPSQGFAVKARSYVLAAGGIENARLLLVSRDRQSEGLGNGDDLVGRCFMEHPHYATGWLVPSSSSAFDDRTVGEIHVHEGLLIQRKHVLKTETVRKHELLGCAFRLEAAPLTDSYFTLRYSERAEARVAAAKRLVLHRDNPDEPSTDLTSLAEGLIGLPQLARHAATRLRVRASRNLGRPRFVEPQLYWMRAMAEQAPDMASRLHLIDQPDDLGVPKVALDWRLNQQDLDSMRGSQALIAAALRTSGHQVGSLLEGRQLPPALSGGMHHMGTTRMHDSPRHGVVDRDCRVHGVSNLFMAGSSVFPTAGYANPTLTILALALRLSEHLKSTLKEP